MPDFLKINGEIDALINIRSSLDENSKKIEKNLENDKKLLPGAEKPCSQISEFIKSLEGEINAQESIDKKCSIAIAALIQINKFSNEYVINERMKIIRKEGMLEGFKIYIQTIDEHIDEKKGDLETLKRIDGRVKRGEALEDIEKRRTPDQRPERVRDIRMFKDYLEEEL